MLPWKLVNILFLIIRKKLKKAIEKMFLYLLLLYDISPASLRYDISAYSFGSIL